MIKVPWVLFIVGLIPQWWTFLALTEHAPMPVSDTIGARFAWTFSFSLIAAVIAIAQMSGEK